MNAIAQTIRAKQASISAAEQERLAAIARQNAIYADAKERCQVLIDQFNEMPMKLHIPPAGNNFIFIDVDKEDLENGARLFLAWWRTSLALVINLERYFVTEALDCSKATKAEIEKIETSRRLLDAKTIAKYMDKCTYVGCDHAYGAYNPPSFKVGSICDDGRFLLRGTREPMTPAEFIGCVAASDWVVPFVEVTG